MAAQRVLVGKVRAADVALGLACGGGGAPRPPAAHRVHLSHVVLQLRLQRESEQNTQTELKRVTGQKGRMVYDGQLLTALNTRKYT